LIALLLISAFFTFDTSPPTKLTNLTGYPQATLRFTALFMSGAAFYIFRSAISYRNDLALTAAVLLVGMAFNHGTEELAMPVLGGYLIFWFSFLKNTPRLNRINNSTDLSYGIYLYAWPIQNLLIKFIPGITPPIVIMLTTIATVGLACLSWRLIEKPSLSLKQLSVRSSDLQRAERV
jgi:peptidoglycan/LPS O-acetylase OafA/YrhL